jgi:hypothetical protein
MIELVLGYKQSNESPILKLLLRDWTSWWLVSRRRRIKLSCTAPLR